MTNLRDPFTFQSMTPVLCLGQDFWGTQVSLYLNFRGTFTNSGGHTKSFKFLPVKLNSYPEISVHFLFKFELHVDRFGSRRGVDDSKVVFAIGLVLNSPASLLFLYKIAFFLAFCYEVRVFCHCCCVLDCAIYFPLLGYTKCRNSRKQRKIKNRF